VSRVLISSTQCALVLLWNRSAREGPRWSFPRWRGPQLLKQTLTTHVLTEGLCRLVLEFGNSTQVGQGVRQHT